MYIMRTKVLAVLLVLRLMTGLLAACGNAQGGSTAPAESVAEASETQASGQEAAEPAQTPEEAAYLAARGSRLYRKRLIAVLCNSTEEPVLESHLKRWSVVDDKRRHEKPAYWRGLASTVEEALALAKVCWTNRTILKWDRSYRWCNPAAECVSEAV